MTVTQYIGARYVPVFAEPVEWNNTRTYEPLTIVMHEGNSYTSKQYVPVGIDINNAEFWAETGNYNAQVEQYRQEVLNYADDIREKAFSFNNIEEMKQDGNLYENAQCFTHCRETPDDNGGSWYRITASPDYDADEQIVIACSNNLYAQMIDTDVINAGSIGLKPEETFDNTPVLKSFLQKYMGRFPFTLKFNAGLYKFSPLKIASNNRCGNFILSGTSNGYGVISLADETYEPLIDTFIKRNIDSMTMFSPFTDQNYIFYFEGMQDTIIENILFTTSANNGNDNSTNLLEINDGIIIFEHMVHSVIRNVNFEYVFGPCIVSQYSYEITVTDTNFRWCVCPNNPTRHGCIEFRKSIVVPTLNSSAWIIANINFELILSHWIYVEDARVQNVACSNIIGESGRITINNARAANVITTINSAGFAVDEMHSFGVISSYNCKNTLVGFSFESLSIDNMGLFYNTIGNENYNFNCVVCADTDTTINVGIGVLQLSAPRPATWYFSGSGETTGETKSLTIGKVFFDSYASNEMNIIRGTLTRLNVPRPPLRFTNDTRIYTDFEKLFEFMPCYYAAGQRMWTKSDQSFLDVAKLTPITQSASPYQKRALQIPATGYSKIIVLAARNSNLTVELANFNNEHLADATTEVSASYKAYIVDVAAYDETVSTAFIKKCVNVYGDGENAEQIFDVILR